MGRDYDIAFLFIDKSVKHKAVYFLYTATMLPSLKLKTLFSEY